LDTSNSKTVVSLSIVSICIIIPRIGGFIIVGNVLIVYTFYQVVLNTRNSFTLFRLCLTRLNIIVKYGLRIRHSSKWVCNTANCLSSKVIFSLIGWIYIIGGRKNWISYILGLSFDARNCTRIAATRCFLILVYPSLVRICLLVESNCTVTDTILHILDTRYSIPFFAPCLITWGLVKNSNIAIIAYESTRTSKNSNSSVCIVVPWLCCLDRLCVIVVSLCDTR